MSRVASVALALSVAVVPMSAGSQQEPPEGCFCWAEATQPMPQIQRGCSREKFQNQYYWRAICRYVDPTGEIVVAPSIMITNEWEILPADDPECAVCDPAPRNKATLPRGDDEGGEEGDEGEGTE